MRILSLGIAVIALAAAETADAATVSFTGSSNGSNIALSRFDTVLGTLTGVLFEVKASTTTRGEFQIAYNGATATSDAIAYIATGFAGLAFQDYDRQTLTCKADLPTNGLDAFCSVWASASANLDEIMNVAASDFGLVSGTGFVFAQIASVGDTAIADVKVTYTYDPSIASVPLPATGGMLLTALGGLAFRRRRAASCCATHA